MMSLSLMMMCWSRVDVWCRARYSIASHRRGWNLIRVLCYANCFRSRQIWRQAAFKAEFLGCVECLECWASINLNQRNLSSKISLKFQDAHETWCSQYIELIELNRLSYVQRFSTQRLSSKKLDLKIKTFTLKVKSSCGSRLLQIVLMRLGTP